MALRLIIGNKNYSSWSLRPWIAMKTAGIAFEEEVISLDAADFKTRVTSISGTGKVPALADGNVQVWESLAILEYLAEKFPDARLWPTDRHSGLNAASSSRQAVLNSTRKSKAPWPAISCISCRVRLGVRYASAIMRIVS